MNIVKKVMNGMSYEEFSKNIVKEHEEGIENPDYFGTDINNKEFWQYISENYPEAYSPVAKSYEDVNKWNLGYAKSLGIDTFFPCCHMYSLPINGWAIEIGPGLGATRDYIKSKFSNYIGLDLVSHFDDVVEIEEDNLPKLESDSFIFACASNVFQHLSVERRRNYYSYIHDLLMEGGKFFVTHMINDNKSSDNIITFGQITKAQSQRDVINDLTEAGFNIRNVNQRLDSNIGIVCQK